MIGRLDLSTIRPIAAAAIFLTGTLWIQTRDWAGAVIAQQHALIDPATCLD